MKLPISKPFLLTELAVLMLGVPLLLWLYLPPRVIMPTVWFMALLCYRLSRHYVAGDFWNFSALTWANLRPMLMRFLLCVLLMLAATYHFKRELLFGFVLNNPAIWALVMLLYPVLSVVAQEVIFRRYIFARYASIFSPVMLIAISGIGFGFAHVVLHNWVAPSMCVVGGLFFAQTYQKTRSLALVSIEHALYGNALFTIGLGSYFYHGAVGMH